jgi:serine/threonine protein kinase
VAEQYLHEHDPPIIHRDISAKNIMLDGARVKVCDLGQAKFFNVTDRQTAAPGAVVYAAPEVGHPIAQGGGPCSAPQPPPPPPSSSPPP